MFVCMYYICMCINIYKPVYDLFVCPSTYDYGMCIHVYIYIYIYIYIEIVSVFHIFYDVMFLVLKQLL